MKITIEVEGNEPLEPVFTAECLSVESAVQELYRFERHILPGLKEKEIDF